MSIFQRTFSQQTISIFLILILSLAANSVVSIDLNDSSTSDWQQDEFLPAERAFPFSVNLIAASSLNAKANTIHIEWKITEGYYLYAETVSLSYLNDSNNSNTGHSKQTDASLPLPQFSAAPIIKYDPNFDKDMAIFKGLISANFSLNPDIAQEQLVLKFQGCAEAGLCYPMQSHALSDLLVNTASAKVSISEDFNNSNTLNVSVDNNLPNAADSQNTQQVNASSINTPLDEGFKPNEEFSELLGGASLIKIILIFLALGIGLCLTPCVLPMMPIISGLVLGREKPLTSLQAFGISSTYVLAMSLSYTAVGILAASLGASANIQIWMQHPAILTGFAIMFVLLALSMFDLYELRLPNSLNEKLNNLSNKQESGSYIGAAVMGVLSAVVVSPCISAPLAGALVFISTTGDTLIGASALFALGIGMGLPLILLCTLGTNMLPKAGAWLNHSKRFFGVLLIGVAVWMLSRFINPQLALALWGALFVFASFAFGTWQNANALLKTLLSICLLWGVIMILGAALGNTKPLQPLENITTNHQKNVSNNSQGESSNKEALSFKVIESLDGLDKESLANKGSGKILLLDFYADWCTSCKEIEHQIFENPRFKDFLASTHLVRADLSKNSVENFQLLENLRLFGPPAILFFNDQGKELEGFRIQGTINPDKFQDLVNALNKI